MFALFIYSLVQKLIFEVELLCEHKVFFETLVPVSPDEIIALSFAADVAHEIDLELMVTNSFLHHRKETRAEI